MTPECNVFRIADLSHAYHYLWLYELTENISYFDLENLTLKMFLERDCFQVLTVAGIFCFEGSLILKLPSYGKIFL